MNLDRRMTQCRAMTPWYNFGLFFLLWFLYSLAARCFPQVFGRLRELHLDMLVGMLACGLITIWTHQFFFWGDIILTSSGVETKSRIKSGNIAWKDCAQVIALDHLNDRILVLLKPGGSPMKERDTQFWFFLRNPGKVIFLPDDQFTREFVAEYYGPLDFDLSDSSKEA